jgi:hypothetical protein
MASPDNSKSTDSTADKGVTVIRSIEMRGPRLRKVGYAERKKAAEAAKRRSARGELAS